MQLLHNKDLIPNHTLQRLIQIWSDSILTRSHSPPIHSLSSDIIAQLQTVVVHLHRNSLFHLSRDISSLTSFARESDENRTFLAASGGRILPSLVALICRVKDLSFLEKLVLFCNILLENHSEEHANNALIRSSIDSGNCDIKASIVMALKQGRLELRIAAAKFLDHLSSPSSISVQDDDDDEIYSELLRLITTSDWNAEAMDASLSLLTRWGAILKRNRAKMVRAGGVRVLAAALWEAEMSVPSTEKALKLLEMASGCKQGRSQICGDETCLRAIVKKMLKVSNAATEHAVTVVWGLCCVFGDTTAAEAVLHSNGMAKILVVLQSSCSPAVRRMCADLLRVFRCAGHTTTSTCATWYDTKTTHIMPF